MRKGTVQDKAAGPPPKPKFLLFVIVLIGLASLPVLYDVVRMMFDQWKPVLGLGPSLGVQTPFMDTVREYSGRGIGGLFYGIYNALIGALSSPTIGIPFFLALGGSCIFLMRRGV